MKGIVMKHHIILFTLIFSFSLFASDKTKTVTLNVDGMTCQSCDGTVEKSLKKVTGVKEAKVDLKNNTATITLAGTKTTTASLIKAVSDAGFDASEGTARSSEKKNKSKVKESDACGDDCCGDEGTSGSKQTKGKKTEGKKS